MLSKEDKDADTLPEITECYGECGVNLEKIVRRIIKYVPPDTLRGLREIRISGRDPDNMAFGCYYKKDRKIELFAEDIIGWQPWLLKKTYIFPYLSTGLALGHEIDHHVKRNDGRSDKEKSAENNALKYVYPSFGPFKPVAKLLFLLLRRFFNARKTI